MTTTDLEYTHTSPCPHCGRTVAAGTEHGCGTTTALAWYEAAWGWAAIRGTWEARCYLDDRGRWRWRVWHRGCLLLEGASASETRALEAAERAAEMTEGDRLRLTWRRSKRKNKAKSTQ